MVLAKSKNAVGLGNRYSSCFCSISPTNLNSLMNDRFGKGRGADRKKFTTTGVHRVNHATGETYVTNERKEASWVKMQSVTQQPALDEFLSTAELAGTDFTAEKMNNLKIIHIDQKNPFLLSAAEEREAKGKQEAHKKRLTVPRRPKWDTATTPEQLDKMERDSFLDWRRGLAELQESNDLLMTPFERNLEVWRQLWRVIERSDLIVQIVDARNPLLFRSEDLENYVKEIDFKKKNLLLVNKADMLSENQRKAWALYFESAGISYKFFSASMAKEMNEARDLYFDSQNKNEESSDYPGLKKSEIVPEFKNTTDEGHGEEEEDDDDEEEEEEEEEEEGDDEDDGQSDSEDVGEGDMDDEAERTRILTVDELENLFLRHARRRSGSESDPIKIQVGLVGYPNVGKSSTINALIGAKKVSVSSTPGKTKHFQTINLSDQVILCDCPGLVFPNFATIKAELVCNGILPIDQLREFSGPAGLVAKRIPQNFLEALYGMTIVKKPTEEGGTGIPTAEEVLVAYAKARGFTRSGQGQPDESRAARYILKDYVNGKLLFCHPPPTGLDPQEFNQEIYDKDHLPEKHRQATILSEVPSDDNLTKTLPLELFTEQGPKSKKLDKTFFSSQQGGSYLQMPFSHKYSQQGTQSSKLLSGRKQRTLLALEKNMSPEDIKILMSKKHFKKGKKGNGKRRADYFAD
ncbi:ribosome biogenesis GTPase Lsg1 [Blumeria hordei DH14]|uniref:Ribosome biogenesis GTPase Lsg1 n=1 Tax=Blumeria graminis f. sp. hordei (strain DH14) TaxID=546991 RepID=N1JP99_BLUG1|nr:ribosome biogenesis GTPase Lsg1 [Blumeria hordei DH14]